MYFLKKQVEREENQVKPTKMLDNCWEMEGWSDSGIQELYVVRIIWDVTSYNWKVPGSLHLSLGLQRQNVPATREGSWESTVITLGTVMDNHPDLPDS